VAFHHFRPYFGQRGGSIGGIFRYNIASWSCHTGVSSGENMLNFTEDLAVENKWNMLKFLEKTTSNSSKKLKME